MTFERFIGLVICTFVLIGTIYIANVLIHAAIFVWK